MNATRNQKQQLLAQVADLPRAYVSSFPKETAAAELTAEIRSAVTKLSGYANLQVSSQAQIQASSAQRVQAHQALTIVDHNFLLLSSKNDSAMINAAHSFVRFAGWRFK